MKFTDLIPGKIYFQNYPDMDKIYNFVFIFDKLFDGNTMVKGGPYINVQGDEIYPSDNYSNSVGKSIIRPATNREIQQLCDCHKLDPALFLQTSYEIY